MNLPWIVTRATAAALLAEKDAQINLLREMLAEERNRIPVLIEAFTPKGVPVAAAPVAPKRRRPVKADIDYSEVDPNDAHAIMRLVIREAGPNIGLLSKSAVMKRFMQMRNSVQIAHQRRSQREGGGDLGFVKDGQVPPRATEPTGEQKARVNDLIEDAIAAGREAAAAMAKEPESDAVN